MLPEITCSNCSGAGLELQPDGQVVCRYCGTPNVMAGPVCPNCEHVNSPGAQQCANCRLALVRTCPTCGLQNWSGAERCVRCGRALDAVALMSARLQDPSALFHDQQASAPALKAQEEADSQRRMAHMLELERRLQQSTWEAARRTAARDRQIMFWVLVGVIASGALIALALIVAFLAN